MCEYNIWSGGRALCISEKTLCPSNSIRDPMFYDFSHFILKTVKNWKMYEIIRAREDELQLCCVLSPLALLKAKWNFRNSVFNAMRIWDCPSLLCICLTFRKIFNVWTKEEIHVFLKAFDNESHLVNLREKEVLMLLLSLSAGKSFQSHYHWPGSLKAFHNAFHIA